tara:strand:- start:590 stop:847 length:258 start_codon:yes stop_codon:yes gene_type:complete
MEGYYYGYCILEQTRIRDEKYRKKYNSTQKSTSSSTSSLSSTGSNSEPLRGSTTSTLTTINENKPLGPKRTKGHWFYNQIYNTFE